MIPDVVPLHGGARMAALAALRAARRALDAGDTAEARRVVVELERLLEVGEAEGETA